jgi:hypothetical protein
MIVDSLGETDSSTAGPGLTLIGGVLNGVLPDEACGVNEASIG